MKVKSSANISDWHVHTRSETGW